MNKFTTGILLTAIILAGCITEDQRTLNSYYREANNSPRSQAVIPGELYNFIKDVAQARTTQENNVEGRAARGVYTGHDTCDRVAVIDLDVRNKKQLRARNYRVCGTQIMEADAGEVTPSYPKEADAKAALISAQRNAILYGQQRTRFQDYTIDTQRLGVSSGRPCQPVQTLITYGGNLVLQDVAEVCN